MRTDQRKSAKMRASVESDVVEQNYGEAVGRERQGKVDDNCADTTQKKVGKSSAPMVEAVSCGR